VNSQVQVLFFQSDRDLFAQSCIDALNELGFSVRVERVGLNELGISEYVFNLDLLKYLLETPPQFVFFINGLGITEDGFLAKLLALLNIPYCCWYIDQPYMIRSSQSDVVTPYLIGCVADDSFGEQLLSAGANSVYYLPGAADPKRMNPQLASRKLHGPSDLTFVGRLNTKWVARNLKRLESVWPDYPSELPEPDRIFEGLMQAGASITPVWIVENIRNKNATDEQINALAAYLDIWVAQKYRRVVIESLCDFSLRIYGEPEWLEVNSEIDCREPFSYFSGQLPKVYGEACINLNITNPQLRSGFNQRVFDVLACGGLLLTDQCEDFSKFFDVESDFCVVHTLDELQSKVQQILTQPKQAALYKESLVAKVHAEHTFVNRMLSVVSWLESFDFDAAESKLKNNLNSDYYKPVEMILLYAKEKGRSELLVKYEPLLQHCS
jgi:spore maturation protein CgeB